MKLPRSLTWDFTPTNILDVTGTDADLLPVTEQSDETYRVFAAWPREKAPASGYPVIYVLDANAIFGTVVELIRMRTHRPSVLSITPPVVVGIGYPIDTPYDRIRRSYDLSWGPPRASHAEAGEPRIYGGAQAFESFVRERVVPKVGLQFPIDPTRRTLVGHSLAGNFTLSQFARGSDMFDNYIAISPSIWWDLEAHWKDLELRAPHVGRQHQQSPALQVAVGEYEEKLAPWEETLPNAAVIRQRRESRQMVSDSAAFCDRINTRYPWTGGATHHIYVGEDHSSVLQIALGRTINNVIKAL